MLSIVSEIVDKVLFMVVFVVLKKEDGDVD